MYSITAIVPAYNEEKTIGNVLEEIKNSGLVDEIIVVSDGSTDGTVEIAKAQNIEVIELSDNIGKGGALKKGIERCNSDIILLLDADLIGLNFKHIQNLINPVLEEEVDMTVGIFNKGRLATDFAQRVTPYLSGQRGIRRNIIDSISNMEITRYGAEVAINKYVKDNNIKFKEVPLENLTHMMKEEKFGVVKGITERMRMYWEVAKTYKARR